MTCQMKRCGRKAVSAVRVVDFLKSTVVGRDVIYELCVCRFHKLSWELGWYYAEHGVSRTPASIEEEILTRGEDAVAQQLGLDI